MHCLYFLILVNLLSVTVHGHDRILFIPIPRYKTDFLLKKNNFYIIELSFRTNTEHLASMAKKDAINIIGKSMRKENSNANCTERLNKTN